MCRRMRLKPNYKFHMYEDSIKGQAPSAERDAEAALQAHLPLPGQHLIWPLACPSIHSCWLVSPAATMNVCMSPYTDINPPGRGELVRQQHTTQCILPSTTVALALEGCRQLLVLLRVSCDAQVSS